jgi:hypothetical protein
MTAVVPENLVTDAVRSLEVRWILPGQLEPAVARWFRRFPAASESRTDTYLISPDLRGLSVKVRAGGALEVKAYHGSPGSSRCPAVPAATCSPGRSGRFRSPRPAPAVTRWPDGGRSARSGASAASRYQTGRS